MVVAEVPFGSFPIYKWYGRMGKAFIVHDRGASSAWEVFSGQMGDWLAVILLWGFWVERVAEALLFLLRAQIQASLLSLGARVLSMSMKRRGEVKSCVGL